jgi:glycerophosphoryl diester phosphodiesterase
MTAKAVRLTARWVTSLLVVLVGGCASEHNLHFLPGPSEAPVLLAHRGIAQTFDPTGVTTATCTATRIHPPTHPYLENTIDSIAAAIDHGADVVEIDVHPTKDGEFIVFHDWRLECRTNGSGVTREQTLAYLKSLDIGFGYTSDGGRSFPFRGKAVGQMPSLREVLAAFPEQPLLINIKSNDAQEGALLSAFLNGLPEGRKTLIAVYGGKKPVAVVRERVAGVLTMSRDSLRSCLIGSVLTGWAGVLPKSCERTLVLVPSNYSGWLWGWPDRFIGRMRSVGSAVFVLGPHGGGGSQGIDSVKQLDQLPPGYRGGIWTNELELISEALQQRKARPAAQGHRHTNQPPAQTGEHL